MSADLSFTAAMVQMRTSLSPEGSFKQAESLIREAKDKGADYVQTPEVSNLIQKNRKALFVVGGAHLDHSAPRAGAGQRGARARRRAVSRHPQPAPARRSPP